MHYALLAWGTQCNKIELLQKNKLRVIFSKSPIAHTVANSSYATVDIISLMLSKRISGAKQPLPRMPLLLGNCSTVQTHALRQCKLDERLIVSKKLADHMKNHEINDFWKDIRKHSKSKSAHRWSYRRKCYS